MKRPAQLLPIATALLLFLVSRAQSRPFLSAAAWGQQAAPELPAPAIPTKSCSSRSLLLDFEINRDGEPVRKVPIWRLPESPAFFFASGMTIDADGAPNAYNPENTGLDDIANAGEPGHWQGVVQDEHGNPYVQGPSDPFPGYYVSCTALSDRTKSFANPTRYVDSSKIPYIVLPRDVARLSGARLGDFAIVFNLRSGKSSYAIFADIGTLGEGSIALADNLGIWSNARQGGRRGGILYLVFSGSGNGEPRTVLEINEQGEKTFQEWGGTEQISSCAAD